MAGAVLSSIPLMVLYFVAQRFMVQGVAEGRSRDEPATSGERTEDEHSNCDRPVQRADRGEAAVRRADRRDRHPDEHAQAARRRRVEAEDLRPLVEQPRRTAWPSRPSRTCRCISTTRSCRGCRAATPRSRPTATRSARSAPPASRSSATISCRTRSGAPNGWRPAAAAPAAPRSTWQLVDAVGDRPRSCASSCRRASGGRSAMPVFGAGRGGDRRRGRCGRTTPTSSRAVLPVAEEAGVILALHPDDPPVPMLGGVARLFHEPAGFQPGLGAQRGQPRLGTRPLPRLLLRDAGRFGQRARDDRVLRPQGPHRLRALPRRAGDRARTSRSASSARATSIPPR